MRHKILKDKVCDQSRQAWTGRQIQEQTWGRQLSFWAPGSGEGFPEEVQPKWAFLKDKDWNYEISLPFGAPTGLWPDAREKLVNNANVILHWLSTMQDPRRSFNMQASGELPPQQTQ